MYATRAHDIFGYGIAEIKDGNHGGQSATIKYTENDLRFSVAKDGSAVYIYSLGLPAPNTKMSIKSIIGSTKNYQVKGVSVVGSGVELDWSANGDLLEFTTPSADKMDEVATVLKVML